MVTRCACTASLLHVGLPLHCSMGQTLVLFRFGMVHGCVCVLRIGSMPCGLLLLLMFESLLGGAGLFTSSPCSTGTTPRLP